MLINQKSFPVSGGFLRILHRGDFLLCQENSRVGVTLVCLCVISRWVYFNEVLLHATSLVGLCVISWVGVLQ